MVDEKDDKNNEHNEPDLGEEEDFSEEFNFEEDAGDDDHLGANEFENTEEFDDTQENEESQIEPPKQKSAMLPIVIGLLVVGFIAWKIYGFFFKAPPVSPIETTEKEVSPIVTSPPPAAIVPPPEPPSGLAERTAPLPLPDEDVTKLQKAMEAQEERYKQQVDALEKNLAATLQHSADTNKNIAALQHDVAALSAALQTLSAEMEGIHAEQQAAIARQEERAKRKAKPKPKGPSKASVASPTMTVHAIIPGRAWLRTTDGKTITVTEGDPLAEYGKVLKIDAPNGVVITSSGVVLR